MEKAVAYIRVSSQRQVDEGSSLDSQMKLVEKFAASTGIHLVQTFREEGESAKTDQRPMLQQMLKYCLDRKNGITIVIVPKIDRLARNVHDYTNLKLQLSRMGIRLESLGERIDDTPVGRFTETILASVAQFDNEIRAERSKGGMMEAVSQGRWVWQAPIGYRSVRFQGKGTIEPDPKYSPLIAEAFRLLVGGHQGTKSVREFLANSGISRSESSFYRMLQNEAYIGRIHAFDKVFDAKPPFVPIVDEETFYKVQEILVQRTQPQKYQLESVDYPLRGSMLCPCQRFYSGAWSRGKQGKRYAYYRCPHCSGKSYKPNSVHMFFRLFAATFKGNPQGWERLRLRMEEYLHERSKQLTEESTAARKRIEELHNIRDSVALKNASGVLPDDLAKRQIDRLTSEISKSSCLIPNKEPDVNVNELVDFAEQFFFNLEKAWESLSLKIKRDLLRFMFPNGVLFYPERGFRTLQNSLAEQFLRVLSGTDLHLVDPAEDFTKELHEWLLGLKSITDRD